jgi:hypothetical protein
MMLAYAVALFLILGAGMFALQAIQAHVRHEQEEAKLYWSGSAGCLAVLAIGFLIIRFV